MNDWTLTPRGERLRDGLQTTAVMLLFLAGMIVGGWVDSDNGIRSIATPSPHTSTPHVQIGAPRMHTLSATRHSIGSAPHRASRSYARSIARGLAYRHGWIGREYRCLVRLWDRESRWDLRARNAKTGALGIPQAVPGSKMRAAGADYRSNPRTQISWGLSYISTRYGAPCAALRHQLKRGWY